MDTLLTYFLAFVSLKGRTYSSSGSSRGLMVLMVTDCNLINGELNYRNGKRTHLELKLRLERMSKQDFCNKRWCRGLVSKRLRG